MSLRVILLALLCADHPSGCRVHTRWSCRYPVAAGKRVPVVEKGILGQTRYRTKPGLRPGSRFWIRPLKGSHEAISRRAFEIELFEGYPC